MQQFIFILTLSFSPLLLNATVLELNDLKEIAAIGLSKKAAGTCNEILHNYTAKACCDNKEIQSSFFESLKSIQATLELYEKNPTNQEGQAPLLEDYGSVDSNIDGFAQDATDSNISVPPECTPTRLTNAKVKFKTSYVDLIKQNPTFLNAKNVQAVCEKIVGLYLTGKNSFIAANEADASLCDPVAAPKKTQTTSSTSIETGITHGAIRQSTTHSSHPQ